MTSLAKCLKRASISKISEIDKSELLSSVDKLVADGMSSVEAEKKVVFDRLLEFEQEADRLDTLIKEKSKKIPKKVFRKQKISKKVSQEVVPKEKITEKKPAEVVPVEKPEVKPAGAPFKGPIVVSPPTSALSTFEEWTKTATGAAKEILGRNPIKMDIKTQEEAKTLAESAWALSEKFRKSEDFVKSRAYVNIATKIEQEAGLVTPPKKQQVKEPKKIKPPEKKKKSKVDIKKYYSDLRRSVKKTPIANIQEDEIKLINNIEKAEGYSVEIPKIKRERFLSFIETGNLGAPFEIIKDPNGELGSNIYKFERPYGTAFYEEKTGKLYIEPTIVDKSVVSSSEEIVGMDIDERAVDIISRDTIGTNPSVTIVNELFQNSTDAFPAGQKDRNISIGLAFDGNNHTYSFSDNGKGMSTEEVKKYFLTVGAEGKKGTTTSGGYGFAKTAFLLWPKNIDLVTRKRMKDGNIERTSFSASPDDIRKHRVKLKREVIESPQVKPGTDLVLTLPDEGVDANSIEARTRNYIENIRKSPPIKIEDISGVEYTTKTFSSDPKMYNKDRLTVGKNVVDVYYIKLKKGTYQPRDYSGKYRVEVVTYNKGLPVYVDPFTWNIGGLIYPPGFKAYINFVKTAKPGTEEYPFLDNRKSINYPVVAAVREAIQNKVKSIDKQKLTADIKEMRDMIENAPVFHGIRVLIPFKSKTEINKATKLVRKHEKLFSDLAKIYKFFNDKLVDIGEKKIELAVTIDPHVHGTRSNPKVVGFSIYAINPFSVTKKLMELPGYKSAVAAGVDPIRLQADNFVETLVHEFAHNKVQDHTEDFTTEHSRLDAVIGFRFLARLSHETYNFFDSNRKGIETIQKSIGNLGKGGSRFYAYSESKVRGQVAGPGIASVVGAGKERTGVVRTKKGTIPGRVGNLWLVTKEGIRYETHKSLHLKILEDFPEIKPEDVKQTGVIVKGGRSMSLSLGSPYHLSNKQMGYMKGLARAIKDALRKINAPEELLKDIEVRITPWVALDVNAARDSLKDWERRGYDVSQPELLAVPEAVTFMEDAKMLMQLSRYHEDFSAMRKSAYHGYFHALKKRGYIAKGDLKVLDTFIKNEEDQADLFAKIAHDSRSEPNLPGPVKRVFLRIKRFLQLIKNWMNRKKLSRPEDVMGKLLAGQFAVPSKTETMPEGGQKLSVLAPTVEGMHVMKNPEMEAIFRKSSDYSGPTFWEKAKDRLVKIKNKATREFEHLEKKSGYYSKLRMDLLRLAKQKGVVSPQALFTIEDITNDLNRVDYHNFVRQVVFRDWLAEAELQQENGKPITIPLGMTIDELRSELSSLDKLSTPDVHEALKKREKKWSELKTKYTAAMSRINIDVKERFKRKDYFRRVVMDYVETSGLYGTGRALKSPSYRSFLRERTGSEKMIYTDYVRVEHEVMAQMLYDIQLANTIHSIDQNYNDIDIFKTAAVEANYKNVISFLDSYAQSMDVEEGKQRPTGEQLYRQLGTKMAIGFNNLGRLAASGELPVGKNGEYDGLVSALAENWTKNIEVKRELGKEWTAADRVPLDNKYASKLLTFANYILKAKESYGEARHVAATIFKGIAERKRAVKEILGPSFVTWEKLVKDHPDYTTWQPERGNIFFNIYTIPEQIAEDLMSGSLQIVNVEPSKIKKMLAMGGKKRQLVIRNEIAKTLDNIAPARNENWSMHRVAIKRWKEWQLGSPRRTFKYNFRNLSGDADAVFVGNPGSIKKAKQATIELVHLAMLRSPTYNRLSPEMRSRLEELFGKPELTPELNEWIQRGGYGTLLQAQELDHFSDLVRLGDELTRKAGVKSIKDIPKTAWKGYWRAIRRATDTREAILRYASYLDYLEQMMNDPKGTPKNFGASIPEEVMGLGDIRDRAFWLSNELLGAYDRVSVMGQTIREHLIPFWSWKEANFVRYKRLLQNAIHDYGLMEGIGRRVAGTAIRSPFLAARIGVFAVKATFLLNALTIWNLGLMGDNDKDLPEEVRNRPHLTLWRDSDGEVQYFSRLGALGDLLEWFSLDTAYADIKDLIGGKKTIKEKVIEMAQAPVNTIVQGGQPFLKVGAELIAHQSFFPDLFKPRVIRDRVLHIARSMGLESEYTALLNTFVRPMPGKGYKASLKKAFWYEADPFEAAYYDTFTNKRTFMKRIGKFATGFWLSPTGSSLYNARASLRYKDKEAFLYYMKQYIERGGTIQGLRQSLDNLNPLSGMNKEQKAQFVAQLNPEDLDKLVKALVFYLQLRRGINANDVWEVLGKKAPVSKKQAGIAKLGEIAKFKQLTKKGGK